MAFGNFQSLSLRALGANSKLHKPVQDALQNGFRVPPGVNPGSFLGSSPARISR